MHSTTIKISGKDVSRLLNEAGSHRIQRIPPTEKRGRVHTSTVTVVVLDHSVDIDTKWSAREPGDFRIEWFSGTGKGGQNRNKVQCCCRLIHIPTGTTQTAQTRSRDSSYSQAMESMLVTLDSKLDDVKNNQINGVRQSMVGTGYRSNKHRTYRFQDDVVIDHRSGKQCKSSKVMKGGFDLLW